VALRGPAPWTRAHAPPSACTLDPPMQALPSGPKAAGSSTSSTSSTSASSGGSDRATAGSSSSSKDTLDDLMDDLDDEDDLSAIMHRLLRARPPLGKGGGGEE